MPLVDSTTVLGGLSQKLLDWVLGDDRQFSGDVQSSVNPPPIGDLSLTDAYFTLKKAATDIDANAIIQKHITQVLSASGQITAGLGGALSAILVKIASGDYQSLVTAGTSYYWDFRGITTNGVTFTFAKGTVAFQQNVAQVDKAGTPATFPNSGNPQFRGFISAIPSSISSLTTTFNVGDFYFNSVPSIGSPIGWVCIGQGAPGVWVAFGSISSNSFAPATAWTFGAAAPVTGTHSLGDIVWNNDPNAGGVIGFVCIAAGTPGTWKSFGLISV